MERELFVQNTIRNLNLLYDIFSKDLFASNGEKVKELRREYIILSLYLLLRHLRENYVFGEVEKQLFYDFFLVFHDRWTNPDDEDKDILQFSAHRQQSMGDIETRQMIIRQLYFQFLEQHNAVLTVRDGQRIFSELQRIGIYRRDKGLCQLCLEEGKNENEARVAWKEYDADHVLPHSKGGRTEKVNGRVLCRYHNRGRDINT